MTFERRKKCLVANMSSFPRASSIFRQAMTWCRRTWGSSPKRRIPSITRDCAHAMLSLYRIPEGSLPNTPNVAPRWLAIWGEIAVATLVRLGTGPSLRSGRVWRPSWIRLRKRPRESRRHVRMQMGSVLVLRTDTYRAATLETAGSRRSPTSRELSLSLWSLCSAVELVFDRERECRRRAGDPLGSSAGRRLPPPSSCRSRGRGRDGVRLLCRNDLRERCSPVAQVRFSGCAGPWMAAAAASGTISQPRRPSWVVAVRVRISTPARSSHAASWLARVRFFLSWDPNARRRNAPRRTPGTSARTPAATAPAPAGRSPGHGLPRRSPPRRRSPAGPGTRAGSPPGGSSSRRRSARGHRFPEGATGRWRSAPRSGPAPNRRAGYRLGWDAKLARTGSRGARGRS